MIRFLSFMFGKPYETCKSCETLKEQLRFANEEKRQLTDTLLRIISPKAVEAPPIEINQIASSSALFSRRRAALEARDRAEAKILQEKKHLGVPDKIRDITPQNTTDIPSITELEAELGVEQEKAN